MQGGHTVSGLHERLGIPMATLSRTLADMRKSGLVNRSGRVISCDEAHPLVRALVAFAFAANQRRDLAGLATDVSLLRVMAEVSRNDGATPAEVRRASGLGRSVVYGRLRQLVELGVLVRIGSKPYRFLVARVKEARTLASLACEVATRGPAAHLREPEDALRRMAEDGRLLIAVQYGSSLMPSRLDRLSDVDVLLVVKDKSDVQEVKGAYALPGLDASVLSKPGFLNMLRRQPAFASSIRHGRVLKGKDLFELCS